MIIAGVGELENGLTAAKSVIKAMNLDSKLFEKELDKTLTSTERFEQYEDGNYQIIFTDFRDTEIFTIEIIEKDTILF